MNPTEPAPQLPPPPSVADASPEAPLPARSERSNQRRMVVWSLVFLNLGALTFLMKWADAFFIPFIAGILLTYTLGPVVDVLQRRLRLPRSLGAAAAVLLFVAAVASIGATISWQAISLAESVPSTIQRIRHSVTAVQNDRNSPFNKLNQAAQAVSSALSAQPAPAPEAASRARNVAAATPPPPPASVRNMYDWVLQRVLPAFGSLATLGSVLLLAYFLLSAGDQFRRKTVRLLGDEWARKRQAVLLLNEIHTSLQRYLATLMLTNLLLGVLTWLTLSAMGFENAEMWGVLAGVLHLIPFLGPLLTAAGIFVTGMQQWGTPNPALLAAGATLLIATLVGTLVQASILRRIANINHTAQFVALLYFGWLWGAAGMLIAIPLVVIMKVVATHLPGLHGLAEFLRGD